MEPITATIVTTIGTVLGNLITDMIRKKKWGVFKDDIVKTVANEIENQQGEDLNDRIRQYLNDRIRQELDIITSRYPYLNCSKDKIELGGLFRWDLYNNKEEIALEFFKKVIKERFERVRINPTQFGERKVVTEEILKIKESKVIEISTNKVSISYEESNANLDELNQWCTQNKSNKAIDLLINGMRKKLE